MTATPSARNRRILVIDDRDSIHDDFRKILASSPRASGLAAARAAFMGAAEKKPQNAPQPFELTFASQGQEGFELARRAERKGNPFAAAFVDMRMPPGWDGLETVARLWEVCPNLQTVICSAYSDYSWQDTIDRLGTTDKLLILKKPFDAIEVRQLAEALTQKWDLTRQAELKLTQLAEMVAERTADLERARNELLVMNECLEKSRAAAEAANHSKSEFLANMSHEIRTPTSVILGYADVLCDEEENRCADDTQREALEAIKRNAEYLLAIINDILDLSKIEAGQVTIECLPCSPRQVAEDSVRLLRDSAQRKNLALRVEHGDAPSSILSDSMRLKQIIVNLVGNAVKFTQRGEVTVSLSLTQANDQPALAIDVRDTGIGMTPEQLDRLFQPFSQGDMSTTRRFGGTGLGLVISRRLANLLGGDVTIVETKPGVGTCIRATVSTGLLVAQPAGREAAEPTTGPSDSSEQSGPLNCRVLLAEDGADNRRLISFVLTKAGASTKCVENGRAAVDEVLASSDAGTPYAVVLLDMQMPVLDGYAAARELRERGYDGPIVALTAQALADDRAKCLEAGCDEYLSKPFKRKELLELIRRLSSDNHAAGSTAVPRNQPTPHQ